MKLSQKTFVTNQHIPKRQRYTLRALAVMTFLTITAGCLKLAQMIYEGYYSSDTDLQDYFNGAVAIRNGWNLFPSGHFDNVELSFIYPPMLAIFFLVFPTYEVAWLVWAGISFLCWISCLSLLLSVLKKDLDNKFGSAFGWMILVMALINFPPTLAHFGSGQTQLLILLCMTLGWICLRHQRDIVNGILLGFVISLKLFPALLLLPLIIHKRWKTIVAAISTGVLITVPSFAFIGWEQTRTYIIDILPRVNHLSHDHIDIYTINVTLQMLFGNTPLSDGVSLCFRLLMIGLAAIAMTRLTSQPDRAFLLGVTLLVVVTPVIWSHYFVLIYLPWLVELSQATKRQIVLLGVAYFLMATASLIYYASGDFIFIAQIMPIIGVLLLFGVQLWNAFQTSTSDKKLNTTHGTRYS